MLTYLTSLVVAGIVFCATRYGLSVTPGWGITWAILAFLASQISISLLMRRAVGRVQMNIQDIMLDVQKRLEAKQQHFARHPMGSPKMMMQQMEREQSAGLERALQACDLYKPYYRWNPFLSGQVNAMKMAFNYQLKRFDEVDALLPKCVFFDPQTIFMKMVRMYRNNDPGLEKFFRKKGARLRKDACVLPVCLYAWILLKQGKNDEALKVLADAKKKTSDETLVRNWEALVNGRPKQFSNAGLGDMWYALGLEEPKMPKVQQQYRFR